MTIDRKYQGGTQSSIPGMPDEDEPGGRQAPLDEEQAHPTDGNDLAKTQKAPKVDSDFPDDADMPLPND
jgi:hypothetical protein